MTGLISWAKAEEQATATFTERRQFETAVSCFLIAILSKIEKRNLVVPMPELISWAKAEEQVIATFTERRQFQTAVSLFI